MSRRGKSHAGSVSTICHLSDRAGRQHRSRRRTEDSPKNQQKSHHTPLETKALGHSAGCTLSCLPSPCSSHTSFLQPFPAHPALSPRHRALRSVSCELGSAGSTNTFLSLIPHPVPTLQFKSRAAKQKAHTRHTQLLLSCPCLPPPSIWATQKRPASPYSQQATHLVSRKAEIKRINSSICSSLQ